MLRITQNRKVFYVISAVLMTASLASWIAWGLKPGIDFTGGSLLEAEFSPARPSVEELTAAVKETLGDRELTVQPLGESETVLRLPTISEAEHQELVAALLARFGGDGKQVVEKRFESIGPLIGAELRRKTVYAIVGAIAAIVLYITWAFRKVSHPVASWKYGVCTIVALLHDVAVPVGVLSALGHFHGVEVGAWVVTALLTVLGFSVHDTIVVFDRIREHLSGARRESFEELVNRSMNETLGRSINTSLTVLLVLTATLVFGGGSIKLFVLTMLIGIAAGTYSSIFVASPLLVTWHASEGRRKR